MTHARTTPSGPYFAPHGAHEIEVEGRILRIVTRGPWNVEQVQRYRDNFALCVSQLEGAPWVVLAFVQGEALHTPDSFDALVALVRKQREGGRCATAQILQVDVGALTTRAMFERLYAEAGEPCAFFDREDEARAWLQTQLGNAA